MGQSVVRLLRAAAVLPVAVASIVAAGCAGGTVNDPAPPPELVGVWNLAEEGPSEQTLHPATRSLTLTITEEGAVIYSDDPGSPLALRMIRDLGEPVEGVREGTAGLVTESGAVIRITIHLSEEGQRLQIVDNTRLSSPTRVQSFEKVL